MAEAPVSRFRDPVAAKAFLDYWNDQVQTLNGHRYEKLIIQTQCGPTVVWKHEPTMPARETLVIFPGARTCALFWDLDHALAPFKETYRLLLVEVNGQPNVSAGTCPDTSVQTYGAWARELIEKLGIEQATLLGASLGGQICLTLCLAAPGRIRRAFLVNPGGIRAFSLGLRNVFYNFMPILLPNPRNLKQFFDQVVFYPPHHDVSPPYRQLVEEYMLYVLRNFQFAGKYPAPIGETWLRKVETELTLILGDKDILFPYQGTAAIAQAQIQKLKGIHVLADVAHGIETSPKLMAKLQELL